MARLGLTEFFPDTAPAKRRRTTQKAEPILVSEWSRNAREMIRVRLDSFQGTQIVDIRSWYPSGDAWKPGKSGITLSTTHLTALANALTKALEEAKNKGLPTSPPSSSVPAQQGGA
jgi:hypothetical protein